MNLKEDDHDVPALLQSNPGTRVPLSIITGFLGSGKTTLLKKILTEQHGYRIAVIMNEFGDSASIESQAINVSTTEGSSAPGETVQEIVELANGCLCCSAKDLGIASIEKLMLRKGAFDFILLETTGLADPGPIASMFWQNEDFARGIADIVLDGVICVVDGNFFLQQLEQENGVGVLARQVACADVILHNKVDLVSDDQAAKTEDALRDINPTIPIHRTVKSSLDLANVLDLKAYTTRPQIPPVFGDGHGDYLHGLSAIALEVPIISPVQAERLDEWLRTLLWEGELLLGPGPIEILRCKGVYSTNDGCQYMIQGVRKLYDIERVGQGKAEEGKLVLIGHGLDKPFVCQSFGMLW